MAETLGKHRETEFSGGRPKLEITARDINQIENLSAIGMSQKEISHILDISLSECLSSPTVGSLFKKKYF